VALFLFWGVSNFVVIPVSLNLIATSTLIVFIGSHRSLKLLASEDEHGAPAAQKEILSANDAYKFPFIGSAALFSLYLAFKYLDKEKINLLLAVYFSLAGIFTLTGTISPFLSKFIRSSKKFGFKTSVPVLGELDCLLTPAEIVALILASIFSWQYVKTKHFLMNNVLGISFCIQTIERMSIGSYKVGAVLLAGLFFYDIFWVFGTDVMVTVAKSFDGPIKLLFPRVLATADAKGEFSLLGLGDIVIPGLFVSLLLRFDAVRMMQATANKYNDLTLDQISFPKPYFNTNIICYALGLGVTVGVMYFFQAAQPALLYLVPACLGGSLFTALTRGEWSAIVAYDEEAIEKARQDKLKLEAEATPNATADDDKKSN